MIYFMENENVLECESESERIRLRYPISYTYI
jgi:hypothetical protein